MSSPSSPFPFRSRRKLASNPSSAKFIAPRPHIMGSGPCTYFLAAGNKRLRCDCRQGVFKIQSALETEKDEQCQECTHSLSQHEDFSPVIKMAHDQPVNLAATNNKSPSVSLANPLFSPRTHTVAALWELVRRTQVVHVRGTPASGKTVLAKLLQAYVKETSPNVKVHFVTWMPTYFSSNGCDIGSEHDKLLNYATQQPTSRIDWLNVQNTLLLIDEAQLSYQYILLWNNFIKYLCGARYGPLVVLFSSYGSPSDSPIRRNPKLTPTPIEFNNEQRVSIRPLARNNPNISLYFTQEEHDDVVSRICDKYVNEQPFIPSPELRQYIWEFCNGHPGGTVAVLEALIHSEGLRQFRKTNSEIPLDAAREFLDDDEKLFACLLNGPQGFKRSLPKIETLQEYPDLAQCLRKVIAFNRSKDTLDENLPLSECYENGWLQAEASAEGKAVYVFPTNLHQSYAEIVLRMTSPPFPHHRFPSIKDLCFAAIRKFSPAAIRSGRELGAGALERPVEAQFQDEFYRACYTLLNRNIYLTSEWSGKKLGGRVDFRIKSKKWAVECVREGDRLDHHIARFQTGGAYHKWIISGEIQEYILLDFRTSMPRKIRDNIPFLFFIVFSNDYTCYETYDAKLNLMEKERALTN